MVNPQASNPPVADLLAVAHLAPRQSAKSLSLWPLVLNQPQWRPTTPDYVSLGEALSTGALVVDEVSEGGRVPHVRVVNRGDVAVLFLFGEEIRGAKQNRIVNATFLVPSGGDVVLDVSCVEAGRWSRRPGAGFSAGGEVLSSALRRKMAGKVSRSRRSGQGFHADQGEIWDEIRERIAFAGAQSATAAYADYRKSRGGELDELTRAFHLVPAQVGFVVSLGGEITGTEVIGRPEIFAASFPALLHSYAIDAVEAAFLREREVRNGGGVRFDEPEPFLAAVARARASSGPSLGLGDDLRLEGDGVAGCALACGGLVHLTAFPA
jgi:hypothetical protein